METTGINEKKIWKDRKKGFFTSMFLSNCNELLDCGFVLFENCGEEIKYQNNLFSQRLNDLILSQTPLTEW